MDTFVKQRVSEAAGVQSRRVLAAANGLCNRALRRFLELLYEVGPDGRLYNVDADGRALVAAPWSRTRHADYGLTDHQGRVLRRALAVKLGGLARHLRLFILDRRGPRPGPLFRPGGGAGLARHVSRPADDWLKANDAMPRRGRTDGHG